MSATKEYYHHTIEAAQRTPERPIIFTAEMVRAILDGRKTQTRCIIKFGEIHTHPEWFAAIHQDGGGNWIAWSHDQPNLAEFTKKAYPNGEGFKCPYGYPGDRLYVRETWAINPRSSNEYLYFADGAIKDDSGEIGGWWIDQPENPIHIKRWRHSIYMPRAASRITLQITDIRAERLHDITEADAIAEGFTSGGDWDTAPTTFFFEAWEKIYGRESLESDPWVWVITF